MIALLLVFSLIIGSFLNVVISRVPRSESVIYPGSHCMDCGHALKAADLIPVVSFLFLKGRCRYCHQKISVRYPLVEIITALTFCLVYLQGGLSLWTLIGWLFISILIVAAFIDIDEGIIPDRITFLGIVLGIIVSPFNLGLKTALAGMAAFGLVLLLIAVLSRGGMGGGDIKLAAVIGAFTGVKGAGLVFVIASLLGGIWALFLILRNQANLKTPVKFGPFLSAGGFLAWNWQAELLRFYWSLFL